MDRLWLTMADDIMAEVADPEAAEAATAEFELVNAGVGNLV